MLSNRSFFDDDIYPIWILKMFISGVLQDILFLLKRRSKNMGEFTQITLNCQLEAFQAVKQSVQIHFQGNSFRL